MEPMKKKICILGAGFAGVTCALSLTRQLRRHNLLDRYEIILIDRNPYHLYTPALYEIASIPREAAPASALKTVVGIPLEKVINKKPITLIQDTVIRIDPSTKKLFLEGEKSVAYEHLVIALGSQTNYFNIPGMKEYSYPLKHFSDAVRIRNKVEDLLLSGHQPITIEVLGGGASGVEVAAEFSNFICAVQDKIIKNKHVCTVEVIVREAAPEILPGFEDWMVQRARKRLTSLGVQIQTNSTVAEATSNEIVLKDMTRHHYDILVWSGGVIGAEILKSFHLPLTQKGTIVVNEYLEAAEGIYAVGDSAGFTHPVTGKMLAWNVPAAEAEGKIVAQNIIRAITGNKKIAFHPPLKFPYVLAVGKKYAIADLIVIQFSGFFGWCAKLLIELRYLISVLPFFYALRMWVWSVLLYRTND